MSVSLQTKDQSEMPRCEATLKWQRTPSGLQSRDGRFVIERDKVSSDYRNGCWKSCFNLFDNGIKVLKFEDSQRFCKEYAQDTIDGELEESQTPKETGWIGKDGQP